LDRETFSPPLKLSLFFLFVNVSNDLDLFISVSNFTREIAGRKRGGAADFGGLRVKRKERSEGGRPLAAAGVSSPLSHLAAAVAASAGFLGGIGGTSALERRPECHPVSVPLGGLATPLVPLKILPFFVRGSRLPMRSEEKTEEEVEVEEAKAAAGVLIEEIKELKSCARPVRPFEDAAESASVVMLVFGSKGRRGAPNSLWRGEQKKKQIGKVCRRQKSKTDNLSRNIFRSAPVCCVAR
jgi:hypothetical protein